MTPSAPFRSLPLPSAPERKGHSDPTTAPAPSPSHREGAGSGRGWMTKGRSSRQEKETPSAPDQGVLPEEGFWPAVPIAEVADEWTILRCASAATIGLAQELRDEGLLAWSPIIRVQRRLPRRRKTELVVKPLIPSFVFVAKHHGDEAIDLAERGRVHQCKRFLFNEDEAIVPGHQLSALHLAQIRGTIRKRPLSRGDRVELLASLFYLAKAAVTKGPMRSDTYEVELEGQRQRLIFPGFLLRKVMI